MSEEAEKPTPETTEKPVAKQEEPIELPALEKGLSEKLTSKFGEKTSIAFVKENRVRVDVKKEDVHDVAEFIRDEMNFDHVESVTGVDFPDDKEIEVVYHIGSYTDNSLANQVLTLATRAPREDIPIPGKDGTRLPTLRDVFYSVEFHEREVFEMLGVYFDGHPDNRRLLLPEDWADLPPLRKDFAIKGR
jgi:NADH:ubiquinone oxidoreductase subunit C